MGKRYQQIDRRQWIEEIKEVGEMTMLENSKQQLLKEIDP